MVKLFIAIYRYWKHRRRWGLVLMLCVFGVLAFFASRIRLSENITDFLPKNKQNSDISFVLNNINSQQTIVFNLMAEEPEQSIEASEYFVAQLDSLASPYLSSITYNIDQSTLFETSDFIATNLPLYMDSTAFERLVGATPEGIRTVLERDKELVGTPAGAMIERYIVRDPLALTGSTLEKLKNLNTSDQYQLYDGYMFSGDTKRQIVMADCRQHATETSINTLMSAAIEQAIQATTARYPTLEIAYFGAPLAAVTNANQIKQDSTWALIGSLVLILGLLWYSLRSLRAMLLIALPVLFGALFSIALIQLALGSMSAIALGTSSIILGIAVNYSIHFVSHYLHTGSSEQTLREISRPMVTGCLSAVGAFLALGLVRSEAMRDFGLFAALALVGSILFVLVALPNMMPRTRSERYAFGGFARLRIEKNRYIFWGAVLLTIVCLFYMQRVSFDTNMHKINYLTEKQRKDLAVVSSEQKGKATVYIAALGATADEALDKFAALAPALDSLQKSGDILGLSSIGDFVLSKAEQQQRIERWDSTSKEHLIPIVEEQARQAGFVEGAFSEFFASLTRRYTPQSVDYFDKLPFVKQFIIQTPERSAVWAIATTTTNSKAVIESRFMPLDGVVAFDLTEVNGSMIGTLKDALGEMVFVCLAIVFAVLWFSFRRLELALTSFIPVVASWIIILGLMGMWGIDFNIINIVLVTFIFGLGDDFGILITDGLMQEYAYGRNVTVSFKSSIVLAALTTFFGIGTLIFAKHPAMFSLAQLIIIGMTAVVAMAYIMPPYIFGYLVYKKGKVRKTPITLRNITISIYAFSVFLVGIIYLSIAGFVLLTVMGRNAKNKLRFHKLLCFVSRFVVRNIPFVSTKRLNLHRINLDKPSVWVVNHQSHLDLMYVLSLSPKVIILTNRWVWHSPFYGAVIRYADFYPVAQGIEQSVDRLRAMTDLGYSVVVFAEGTRTRDGRIGRFHQGAFYLARRLSLNVTPILLHGLYEMMPRQEFVLGSGRITVEAMEPQAVKTDNYLIESKALRSAMSRRFEELRCQVEDFDFYRPIVRNNYLYKGTQAEREAKKTLKSAASRQFVASLPDHGTVLIQNCSYGALALMTALVKKGLTVYATDSDADKLALAAHCTAVPANLHYTTDAGSVTCDKVIDAL